MSDYVEWQAMVNVFYEFQKNILEYNEIFDSDNVSMMRLE